MKATNPPNAMDATYQSQEFSNDTSTEDTFEVENERDEVLEIRKESAKETKRVRTWRLLVSLALLGTAVAVTATTYKLLVDREDENFRNVFYQFARSVGDAAIEQQANLRDNLRTFADTVALTAAVSGNGTSPWPYFVMPGYETLAIDFKVVANVEFISINNFVTHDQRDSYIDFINPRYQDFIKEGHMAAYGNLNNLNNDTSLYQPYVVLKLPNKTFIPDIERDHYFCRTLQSPPARKYGPTININLIGDKVIGDGFAAVMKLHSESVITPIKPFANLPEDEHKKMHSNGIEGANNPHSFTFHPIHRVAGDQSSDIVAMFALATAWDVSMLHLLPDNVKGMYCVVQNTCNQTVTYRIDGPDALYLGEGALQPTQYENMAVYVDLNLQTHPQARSTPGHCMYSMKIYPSQDFEDDYKTNTPVIYACVVAGTFLFVAAIYYFYDRNVTHRNEMMISNAAKSNAILTSFLPHHLRDRIINDKAEQQQRQGIKKGGSLKTFLNDGTSKTNSSHSSSSKPLADLFLDTTVLFADISGFTAWSSVREPNQIFTLLETLFAAFDDLAKKRRVFKVETVGDCYVAVVGLPDPRPDHAMVMALFARDIISKMRVLVNELEVTLGPDTAELNLRVGMHSGPVTGGVLRGERTRFQLFGDTMNTCARLESSGMPGFIHASKETADHIRRAGKGDWLLQREDAVHLRGKGCMETFWLIVKGERAASAYSKLSGIEPLEAKSNYGPKMPGLDGKTHRLIDWNVEMLLTILKQVVARRKAVDSRKVRRNSIPRRTSSLRRSSASFSAPEVASIAFQTAETPLEEVREIIALPEFDEKLAAKKLHPEKVDIPADVVRQLHHLVSTIASMYNDNPFHNFDHASHVLQSVIKLMSRIHGGSDGAAAATTHHQTYGITSDPLTQFACAFSALIHDVDHVGVSNAQLVKEDVPLVARYGERSIAEQNSLDLSWNVLMSDSYKGLREFLFPSQTDLVRFRQLVVNSVMSTDIVDKKMKDLRNARWDKAFKTGDCGCGGHDHEGSLGENARDCMNRKATIVIEHIIQASDISHTMQHWHVYRKWNQKLFQELYVAFLNGRMEKNPASFWYKGEFGFFDFYIIPLCQKLKDCGVFGVSSGEFLDFAKKNREEWERQGEEIVAGMIAECEQKYGVKGAILWQGTKLPRSRQQPPLEEQAPAQASGKSSWDETVDV